MTALRTGVSSDDDSNLRIWWLSGRALAFAAEIKSWLPQFHQRPGQSPSFSSSRSAGSSSSFFMIFITSGLIIRRLLVVLPKTLILSLSTRLLWGKTRKLRERKEKQLPHLPQLGQILFFNSSDLRSRIMKGQVKDNLRNKLISSSWNSAWMPFIITSLLFLFTFVTVTLQNKIVAKKKKNFVRNMIRPH